MSIGDTNADHYGGSYKGVNAYFSTREAAKAYTESGVSTGGIGGIDRSGKVLAIGEKMPTYSNPLAGTTTDANGNVVSTHTKAAASKYGIPEGQPRLTTGGVPGQAPTQTPAGLVPYDQALKGLQGSGKSPQDIAAATASLNKMYGITPTQQGFNAAKASGSSAPQVGSSTGNTSQFIPPAPPNTSTIDTALAEDKGYQQLLKDRAEFTHVANQSTSLLDFYNKSIKDAGIPGINAELLNTKQIIDGTEDDIRKEVQAVSGIATDSQVLALASARNKQLIKNYNNLLDTKAMAMESINTMVGLKKEDQQMALQNITQKMNIDEQLNAYRDKFVNNAKEAYNNVLKAVGYAGLYQSLAASGDSSAIGLAERTLGLQPGQLQSLASYTPPQSEEDKLNIQLKKGQLALQQSNLKTDALQRQKISQDMSTQPSIVGGVDEKTMGKIQASPEYKTINGVLPALQTLIDYRNAIKKYGTSEVLNGTGKGELAGTYGNALAAWKTLAGLGALSGADFTLAENAVPSTGFFQRQSTMLGKIDASISNAISQTSNLTSRLVQNYPTAKENLNTQLDYAKAIAYPDKYKVGPDGLVYELTN